MPHRSRARVILGFTAVALAALGVLSPLLAAPPPTIRRTPLTAPSTVFRARSLEREPDDGGACGTRIERALELYQDRLDRALEQGLPTSYSIDSAGIAVMEDDGTFFYSGPGQNQVLDVAAVAQAFYRTHGDDYDALAIYLASGLSTWLGSNTALASAYVVKNDVQGIGLDLFDLGAGLATPPGLHNLLSMNGLNRYPADPDSVFSDPGDTFNALDVLAHEFGHRWLAYVMVDSAGQPVPALLGRAFQHWNFFADVDSSVMEGCDWISPAPDSFVTDGVSDGYGRLDQYLMGLRSAAEIDSFFVVNDPADIQPPGTYAPNSIPEVGVTCRGRATFWHVSDIDGGPRVPDAASSPHAFHVAVVLVTPHGVAPSDSDMAKLGRIRSRFVPYFASATGGRATMNLELQSHAGRVRIDHSPLRDTEDASQPRALGARVTIAQAGIRLAVDPGSVRAFARTNGGSWTAISLSPAASDSFAGALPPAPSGSVVEYYLYAASDSAGIDATDPAGGASAPYLYHVGPDVTPPAITHVPVAECGVDRLPVSLLARITDNASLDSAWVEYSVNGGATSSAALNVAGRDSFSVSLGAGLEVGDVFTYRFAARDRAASPNLGFSNVAFDTMRIEKDWLEDFENGTPTVWLHVPLRRRDPWTLSHQRSSGSSGTAWKAGADDTLPYPPHLDGALITPFIFDLAPGTVLTFDHWWDLEADGTDAFDGAILEKQVGFDGAWTQVSLPDYTHHSRDPALGDLTPCWSGSSNGWHTEVIDLGGDGAGPVRFRFHMAADDFVGREGWYVDHLRVLYPGSTASVALPGQASLRIGPPSPNPARARLSQVIELPRDADVRWELFDLAGRRVALFWRGRRGAGVGQLTSPIPMALASGLYFSKVSIDGVTRSMARVALLR
ncbi:MAG TPA: hypothetical protein VL123_00105 [Candidatus Udaeobacter sp.]|jgi:hypothetical protein|nr:hypothetical protein [Candidatus Udaeobacter sp.]